MKSVVVSLFLMLPVYSWAGLDLAKFCSENPQQCSLQLRCSNGFEIAMKNPKMAAVDRAIVTQPGGVPYETSVKVNYSNGIEVTGIFHPYCHQSLIQEAGWNNWTLVQSCEGQSRPTVSCYTN